MIRRQILFNGWAACSPGQAAICLPCNRALIAEEAAWSQPPLKVQDPNDYVISAWRALGMPIDDARKVPPIFANLGQRVWSPNSPAGWPDRSADWDGASALMERLRWADQIGQRLGGSVNAMELRRSCWAQR